MIERAAILAEGADFDAIVAWITEHAGHPEETVARAKPGGLHGSRFQAEAGAERTPSRYVLPAGALD